MPRLDNAAKAAKALEKLVKSTINPAEKASISLESKKAGLDKIKGANIFADISVPIGNKSKNMELTRDQYVAELHRVADMVDNKRGGDDVSKQHLKALVGHLNPDIADEVYLQNVRVARNAARLIKNNPTLSAKDVGNVIAHHYFKGNVLGHFSKNYLNHIVNTPVAERTSVHSLVKTLTTTKEVDQVDRAGNVVGKVTVPKTAPRNIANLLGIPRRDVIGNPRKYATGRNSRNLSYWGDDYVKGSAVDTAIKTIKRKANVFTDPESRAYFYQMVEDELKTPNGNSLDDIAATVKMLMG